MSSAALNVATSAFAPVARLRTWKAVAYLILGFAIGIGEFVFLVTGLAVGFSLSIVIVGIPLLLAVATASRALGAMDRAIAFLGCRSSDVWRVRRNSHRRASRNPAVERSLVRAIRAERRDRTRRHGAWSVSLTSPQSAVCSRH